MSMYKKRMKILKNELTNNLHEKDRLPDFVEADYIERTGNYQTRFKDGTILVIPRDIFEISFIASGQNETRLRFGA